MKALHGFGFAIVGTLFSAGIWLACSSDNNTPAGDAGSSSTTTTNKDGGSSTSSTSTTSGGTTTSATSGATTGADAGDAGDAGVSDAADASDGNVSCATYCADIIFACGTLPGDPYAQYQSMAECLEVCPLLRRSTDTNVNNIGCRDTHAHLAMGTDAGGTGKPDPHCWHSGPYGYAVCGDPCKSFCAVTTEFCDPDAGTGFDGAAPYDGGLSACEAKCPSFPELVPTDAGVFVDSGFFAWATATNGTNSLDCREYHLLNAINTDPAEGGNANAPNIHCPHTASISAVCGDGG
jgi:hypothetical protein